MQLQQQRVQHRQDGSGSSSHSRQQVAVSPWTSIGALVSGRQVVVGSRGVVGQGAGGSSEELAAMQAVVPQEALQGPLWAASGRACLVDVACGVCHEYAWTGHVIWHRQGVMGGGIDLYAQ